MKAVSWLAALAAVASFVNAELLLQIGSKADGSNVYNANSARSLRKIPQDEVDFDAIDGAVLISGCKFTLGQHYDEGGDGLTWNNCRLHKNVDAGTIFMMQHLSEDTPLPLVTVTDAGGDFFSIYTMKNVTVKAASVDTYYNYRYGEETSTGSVRLSFGSMTITSGLEGKVASTFTFDKQPEFTLNTNIEQAYREGGAAKHDSVIHLQGIIDGSDEYNW